MARYMVVVSIVAIVALAACKRGDDAPARPPPQPPAAVPAAKKLVVPAKDLSGVFGRMTYEAAHRPSGGIPVERVFAALDQAGIAIGGRQQFVGMTMNAAYCAGGRDGGLGVAICEYTTHDDAVAGKALMDKSFPMMNATRVVRAATVITVVHNEATAERARAVVEVVSKLDARDAGEQG
jgi:hypothetical protein